MSTDVLDYAWDTARNMVIDAITRFVVEFGKGISLNETEHGQVKFHSVRLTTTSDPGDDNFNVTIIASFMNTEKRIWEKQEPLALSEFSMDRLYVVLEEIKKSVE